MYAIVFPFFSFKTCVKFWSGLGHIYAETEGLKTFKHHCMFTYPNRKLSVQYSVYKSV